MTEPSLELTVMAAFTLGLAGNVHCLAMCGGIATAFSQLTEDPSRLDRSHGSFPVLYNLGRVTSYAAAGFAAGGVGFLFGSISGSAGALFLRLLLGFTLVFAGLYLAGWNQALTRLESLTRPAWRRLSQAISPLRPVDRAWKAFALGAIWGWLPCGLSYTALIAAAATGSSLMGALLMLGFGVGTLPAMLSASLLSERLRSTVRSLPMRAAAGILVVMLGLWTLSGGLLTHRHWDHATHSAAPAPEPSHHVH
jgi:sulfite exporter TauE/SafE